MTTSDTRTSKQDLGPLPSPRLRTAHDVRHLVGCCVCQKVGDDRAMIAGVDGHYHGRCYIKRWGVAQLRQLPKEQQNKLTLGDIGPSAMRTLLR